MNLYEYMGKDVFRKHGIPVPDGYVVEQESDIRPFQKPVVIKSQILLGGRGKSGGIKFAKSEQELKDGVKQLLGSKIRDLAVTKVLVEEMLDIKKEMYVSIALDRTSKSPILICSAEGGVEIESVDHDKIFTRIIDPLLGYSQFIGRDAVNFMKLDPEIGKQFISILAKLYEIFNQEDCELVEINPLMIVGNGKLVAADSKMVIDSDSLFRHREFEVIDPEKTPLELEANSKGYSFIELDGNIGVIANGAGLTMATLDALTLHKGKPRNFLDLGGTDNSETVAASFEFIMKAKPKSILVNIFGGITKCDTVANGIAMAKTRFDIRQPIVVRLSGIRDEEGRKILKDAGIDSFPSMMEAVERVVKITGGN
ncbi:MAG: ADP-forming succinate--CoA ligase subunit beta [Candidatus Thermoplasmatota archaeon]|jgi:succinyl-CoA synthetase beta subunit|nr:ADP-forming succinate--CoA ligase subunit beta [Candidatus Thermoplasmatota archaeon]